MYIFAWILFLVEVFSGSVMLFSADNFRRSVNFSTRQFAISLTVTIALICFFGFYLFG